MNLSTGIIGLPNVGKSSLFNAITNLNVLSENYPFATIKPNVGTVEMKDFRINKLIEIYKPKKVIKAIVTFIDIAGLVKGASKGQGLGNQFLANIREVSAICHVVRCFEEASVTHVHNKIDPISDIEVIKSELALADLETIEKILPKLEKRLKSGEKKVLVEIQAFEKAKTALNNNDLNLDDFTKDEIAIFNGVSLLSAKPVLYVANLDENSLKNPRLNNNYLKVFEYARKHNNLCIPISAKIESEINQLSHEDQAIFLKDLGIKETGMNKLIRNAYQLLKLETFYTCGPKEVHAWTFQKNTKAPNAAGIIHSDFQKGFISLEVFNFTDLEKNFWEEKNLKEKGKVRIEGKNYKIQDGDICLFRFNV